MVFLHNVKYGQVDNSTKRSSSIDLIRAISILWVVGIWHVIDYVPYYVDFKNAFTYRITVALLGSFVLVSGYLMGNKSIPLDKKSLKNFYLNRFGRIYPPFFVACSVFLIMGMGSPLPLIRAMALLAMLWGPPPFTLWFIAMIVLFYSITPLLCAIRNKIAIYVIVIVVITWLFIIGHWATGAVSPRLAMYFPAYAAGLWLGRRPLRADILIIAGAVIGLAAFPLSLIPSVTYIENSIWSTLWALGLPLLLFGLAMAFDSRLPRLAVIAIIAEASYFLYLFHRPVYSVVLRIVPIASGRRAALLILVGLPIALTIALMGQRIYNRIWQKARARMTPPVMG